MQQIADWLEKLGLSHPAVPRVSLQLILEQWALIATGQRHEYLAS